MGCVPFRVLVRKYAFFDWILLVLCVIATIVIEQIRFGADFEPYVTSDIGNPLKVITVSNAGLYCLTLLLGAFGVAGIWVTFALDPSLVRALCTYFSALTAYGLYAYQFKLKKVAFTFIMAILVMPTQVTAMGFLRLMTNIGLYDSLLPLIIPSIASPAVFYFMYSYLESSLPLSLVEAARIDGSGEFMTFNRIILPIMKPAVAVQAIFTFVGSWNNYFVPALIIQSKDKMTVPILIATLRGADYMNFDMGKIYMMITVAIVPIIVVYLLLSKYIIAGITLGGVKE